MDVWCTVDTSAKCSGEGLRGTTEEKERREEVMYRPNVIPCSYSHVNSVVPELTRYTLQSQHMLACSWLMESKRLQQTARLQCLYQARPLYWVRRLPMRSEIVTRCSNLHTRSLTRAQLWWARAEPSRADPQSGTSQPRPATLTG